MEISERVLAELVWDAYGQCDEQNCWEMECDMIVRRCVGEQAVVCEAGRVGSLRLMPVRTLIRGLMCLLILSALHRTCGCTATLDWLDQTTSPSPGTAYI